MTVIRKEIEIDLPDGLAEKWDVVGFRGPKNSEHFLAFTNDVMVAERDYLDRRLILAPKREPLVTRIARAVIAGKVVLPVTGTELKWSDHHCCWQIYNGNSRVCLWKTGTRELLGPLPEHCCGDPYTVLVSDINAEVERLKLEGGGV